MKAILAMTLVMSASIFSYAQETQCSKAVQAAAKGVIKAQLGEDDVLVGEVTVSEGTKKNEYLAEGTGASRYNISVKVTVDDLGQGFCNLKSVEITDMSF